MQILFSLLTSIHTIYITGEKNLTFVWCFSIPFSRADKGTWQEGSVALHTMLGKCLGMTGRRVNPGQEQQKGDKCSSAEGTFLLVCEAQEGCRRGQMGSGGQLALQLSVQLHRAHPGPKAPAQLQICSRAGGAGALWPRALPWQPSSFCRALIVHPEHALGHHCLPLPSCSSPALASFPTEITSSGERWLQLGQRACQ